MARYPAGPALRQIEAGVPSGELLMVTEGIAGRQSLGRQMRPIDRRSPWCQRQSEETVAVGGSIGRASSHCHGWQVAELVVVAAAEMARRTMERPGLVKLPCRLRVGSFRRTLRRRNQLGVTFARLVPEPRISLAEFAAYTEFDSSSRLLRRGRDSNPRGGVGDNFKRYATLHANARRFGSKWVGSLSPLVPVSRRGSSGVGRGLGNGWAAHEKTLQLWPALFSRTPDRVDLDHALLLVVEIVHVAAGLFHQHALDDLASCAAVTLPDFWRRAYLPSTAENSSMKRAFTSRFSRHQVSSASKRRWGFFKQDDLHVGLDTARDTPKRPFLVPLLNRPMPGRARHAMPLVPRR